MTDIFLVSPNFVRTTTNISSNLQDKYLQSGIREATDIDLQEVLGSNLLAKLKLLIENNTISEPDNHIYKEILDKAKYFLAYSVVARVVVISSFKIDNIGTNKAYDENIQPLEFDDIFKLEQYYLNKADFYKKKLQGFLTHNCNEIPELYKNCVHDIQTNLTSAASCGLWLGGERGKSSSVYSRLAEKYEYLK